MALGLVPEVTNTSWLLPTPIQTIWSKLLLVIFFFASVRVLKSIKVQITSSAQKGNIGQQVLSPTLLYATSPIAIFSVFIFSGYDVFGLFFILLGLRAYFAKEFKWFAFWFSVAISFKYFAAILYLPLVLMIEKRIWYVIAFGVVGLLVSAIQFAMYWHSDLFLEQMVYLADAKTSGKGLSLKFIVCNLAFGVMCACLYFAGNIKDNLWKWSERTIMVCILSYALFFSWVAWHPQWIILITPFICLSFLFISSQRLLMWIEILGYVGFVIFTINYFPGNADNMMVYGGAIASLLPKTQTLASDFIGRGWLGLSRTLFYTMLYMPILIWVVEQFLTKKDSPAKTVDDTHLKNSHQSHTHLLGGKTFLVAIRFLVGAYFLVFISVICILQG
jgi:hypothetical protein